jgi:hypothetical protein
MSETLKARMVRAAEAFYDNPEDAEAFLDNAQRGGIARVATGNEEEFVIPNLLEGKEAERVIGYLQERAAAQDLAGLNLSMI